MIEIPNGELIRVLTYVRRADSISFLECVKRLDTIVKGICGTPSFPFIICTTLIKPRNEYIDTLEAEMNKLMLPNIVSNTEYDSSNLMRVYSELVFCVNKKSFVAIDEFNLYINSKFFMLLKNLYFETLVKKQEVPGILESEDNWPYRRVGR